MAKHIYLSQDERIELEQLIKSGEHQARVLSRARILLLLDRSQEQARTIAAVAEAAMVSTSGVNAIKKRYLTEGLERALYDKPRPGGVPFGPGHQDDGRGGSPPDRIGVQ